MIDQQLSGHFFLHEFCQSETAARMGIAIDPPAAVIENLRKLCTTLLEPIRVQLGRPMVITSGYRPIWLNDKIGGSKTSAHIEGRAADVQVVGMSVGTFGRWIRNNAFPVDQVITEFNSWTHIGISPTPRREFLIATSIEGKTHYEVMPA